MERSEHGIPEIEVNLSLFDSTVQALIKPRLVQANATGIEL